MLKRRINIPKIDENGLYYKNYDSTYKGKRIRFRISGIKKEREIKKMISEKIRYEKNKIDGIIIEKEKESESNNRTLGNAIDDYFNGPGLNFSKNTVYAKKGYVQKYIYGNDINKIKVGNRNVEITFISKFRENTIINKIKMQDYNAWRKELKDIDSKLLGTDYKNKIAYLFHEILENESIHNQNINFKLDSRLYPRFTKTGEESHQGSVLISDEFIELFLNSYKPSIKRDLIFYFIFKTYWFLGLRRNELLALKVSDLKGRQLRINKSIIYEGGKAIVSTPKTKGSNRVVRLSPSFSVELHDFIEKMYGKDADSDLFIFSLKEGIVPVNDKAIYSELKYRTEVLNFEGYKFKVPSIKDFRSSGSTSKFKAAQSNDKRDLMESINSIAKQLGHSQTRTTLDSYIKFQEESEDDDEKEFSEEYYNSFNFRSETQADELIDQIFNFDGIIKGIPHNSPRFTPLLVKVMMENKKTALLSRQ